MKILITGVTGFLGSELEMLLKQNYDVVGVGGRSVKGTSIAYSASDISKIKEKPDLIVMAHGAIASGFIRISEKELRQGNFEFTRTVLEKFPKVPCILASSVSIFKSSKSAINEEFESSPKSEYAISKLQGEKLIQNHPNSTIIRFSSLYGAGMKENTIIPILVNQALEHKKISVFGEGTRLQNYLHVSDAARLTLQLIEMESKWRNVYLGTNVVEHSNIQVASIISRLTDAEIEYSGIDEAASFSYNNSITRKETGWNPFISLEEGLKDYITWKKEQY